MCTTKICTAARTHKTDFPPLPSSLRPMSAVRTLKGALAPARNALPRAVATSGARYAGRWTTEKVRRRGRGRGGRRGETPRVLVLTLGSEKGRKGARVNGRMEGDRRV
eukprot:2849026-Rhodomonas_salina.1